MLENMLDLNFISSLFHSYVFLGGMATCKIISVTFYALAWFFYKPPKQDNNRNVEMVSLG